MLSVMSDDVVQVVQLLAKSRETTAFKCPYLKKSTSICTIFGTIERRYILNMRAVQQVVHISSAKCVINAELPLVIH